MGDTTDQVIDFFAEYPIIAWGMFAIVIAFWIWYSYLR